MVTKKKSSSELIQVDLLEIKNKKKKNQKIQKPQWLVKQQIRYSWRKNWCTGKQVEEITQIGVQRHMEMENMKKR